MWDQRWDNIFLKHEWGKYPRDEVIRFFEKHYPEKTKRSQIKVLEVGCGTGAQLFYLSREGFSTFGIDGSAAGIERTQKRMAREGLEVNLKVGDILNLPYEDNFFDAVLDAGCLCSNSLKDSHKMIKEIQRVLKAGGRFYSCSFATSSRGDNKGKKLEGEENTYTELFEGAFRNREYGILRFTDEAEIPNLYGSYFEVTSLDYLIRSKDQQKNIIKEWLIECQK